MYIKSLVPDTGIWWCLLNIEQVAVWGALPVAGLAWSWCGVGWSGGTTSSHWRHCWWRGWWTYWTPSGSYSRPENSRECPWCCGYPPLGTPQTKAEYDRSVGTIHRAPLYVPHTESVKSCSHFSFCNFFNLIRLIPVCIYLYICSFKTQ